VEPDVGQATAIDVAAAVESVGDKDGTGAGEKPGDGRRRAS
jgi:hypothetical protein